MDHKKGTIQVLDERYILSEFTFSFSFQKIEEENEKIYKIFKK